MCDENPERPVYCDWQRECGNHEREARDPGPSTATRSRRGVLKPPNSRLGLVAISEVYTLSQSPPANGLAFGIGLTGSQVTQFSWAGVALFVAGLSSLLFLGGSYFVRSALPLLSSSELSSPTGPAARQRTRRLTAVNALRATFVAFGAVLMVSLVLMGAIDQVGVRECCSGNNCGPEPGVCSFSVTGLWLVSALQAAIAGLVALGLTGVPSVRGLGIGSGPGGRYPAVPGGSLAGCFLTTLGLSLVALGSLLPWDFFGGTAMYCSEPLCEYPHVLTGYPFDLVGAGTACLLIGAALLILVGLRNRAARGLRARAKPLPI